MRALVVLLFSLLVFSPASAAEKKMPYTHSVYLTFGFGSGPQAVHPVDFTNFMRDQITPLLPSGFNIDMDTRGQWLHPEKGLIMERNAVLAFDVVDADLALAQKISEAYVAQFAKATPAVYVRIVPGTSCTLYF